MTFFPFLKYAFDAHQIKFEKIILITSACNDANEIKYIWNHPRYFKCIPRRTTQSQYTDAKTMYSHCKKCLNLTVKLQTQLNRGSSLRRAVRYFQVLKF